MFELKDLAKYNLSQIEGLLKQHKRQRQKYWILVIIFSTLMSVIGALSIISVCLYATKYHDDFMYYLAIISSVFFGAFLILFFVFFALSHTENVTIRKIKNYLNSKKKK